MVILGKIYPIYLLDELTSFATKSLVDVSFENNFKVVKYW